MSAYKSIINKFGVEDFKISDLPIFYIGIRKRKVNKISGFSDDRLKSFIAFQSKFTGYFWISIWPCTISILSLIIIAILKEWVELIIPIEYKYLYISVSIFVGITLLLFALKDKANKKFQIGRILSITKGIPDLIWQQYITELDPVTLAISLEKRLIIIDSEADLIKRNSDNEVLQYAEVNTFDDIKSWKIKANVIHYTASYSTVTAGPKSFHDFVMIFMGFFLETDPYSVINPEFRRYLDELSLELKFVNGTSHTFNVISNHFNREYGLRGYEDFEIKRSKFRKMQGLILIALILNSSCPEKGFFEEKVI